MIYKTLLIIIYTTVATAFYSVAAQKQLFVMPALQQYSSNYSQPHTFNSGYIARLMKQGTSFLVLPHVLDRSGHIFEADSALFSEILTVMEKIKLLLDDVTVVTTLALVAGNIVIEI